jgi:hypothetical protein
MGMSEIIQKMKVFLQNEIPAEVQMTDIKTKDGIILSFEGELVSGIEIFQVDENGKTPAITGEYMIEDGQTIVVEDGKVAEVKMPEDPIEEPETEDVLPVAEMVEEPIVEEKPIEEKPIEDDRIKKLEDEILQIKNILSELVNEMGKTELKKEIKQDLKLSKIKIKSEEKIEMNTNGGVQNILKNIYKK